MVLNRKDLCATGKWKVESFQTPQVDGLPNPRTCENKLWAKSRVCFQQIMCQVAGEYCLLHSLSPGSQHHSKHIFSPMMCKWWNFAAWKPQYFSICGSISPYLKAWALVDLPLSPSIYVVFAWWEDVSKSKLVWHCTRPGSWFVHGFHCLNDPVQRCS